ncbi:MAG: hydrolase [Theionarchaea archaeon DG-70-1]|nr:MAG: hydrolase [Theionarchaea archaeon DG-70-1]
MNPAYRTKIILLGTGTPNAEPDRSGPSVAIVVGETPYVFDFGPGVVRRAAAAGIPVCSLNKAFLTHLHSDHTAGYPDLILTPWIMGRVEPLEVYGPPGIKEMTEHILTAYEQDIHERLHGLEPCNTTGYHVRAHKIEPGFIYTDSNVRVEAFPVDHGSFKAFAFKFYTPDRTIVISGDTAPTERMIKESRHCDVLIHEVYSAKGFQTHSLNWQQYHKRVHTSSHELAAIASQANPGLVVLYHQLFWGVSADELVAEIKEMYHGKVVSGKDLDIY